MLSLLLICAFAFAGAKAGPLQDDDTLLRSVLVVEPVGQGGRSPVFTDAIQAARAAGRWATPVEGDLLEVPGGEARTWRRLEAAEDGWFTDRALRGGYALATVEAPQERVLLLEMRGPSHVEVNGEPRYGDVYDLGLTRVPVLLQRGTNELLFKAGRGRLRAALVEPPAPAFLESIDRTLPDLVRGEGGVYRGAVLVSNATAYWQRDLELTAALDGGTGTVTPLGTLPGATQRKVGFAFEVPAELEGETAELSLELRDARGELLHADRFELAVRGPGDKHKRTFVSELDGSVQYFAVTPSSGSFDGERRPALFLSLHGAGVEGTNQAYSYAPKDWGHVVAPTGRRPYGFDWEDWGRRDAFEVLAIAEGLYDTDPRRTYLTGHSMGGHGTWNVGVHYPDRFAAIAPSAGWADFWSYSGAADFEEPTPVEAMLKRAANASRTTLLERNLLHGGVYVLHGDADRTVPVREARAMRERLAGFHPNFAYYERPGAGHWWGNACMDWPPLFDFLADNELPEPHTLTELEFTTVNPVISSRCFWLRIEAQEFSLKPSRVEVRLDAGRRSFDVKTENVSRLVLDLEPFARPRTEVREGAEQDATILPAGEPLRVVLDDVALEAPWPAPRDGDTGSGLELWLTRGGDGLWRASSAPAPWYKSARRSGPFKEAFGRRVVFVHGTLGDAGENAWALAKARYDVEVFRYRGNASPELVADVEFDPAAYADRNVILYGNADTNAAWPRLLPRCPIDLRRGRVRVGDRTLEGDDLACLFVYPRADSELALVGVVGGTGAAGARTTTHLPYFVSGVGYPDWVVIGAELLREGAGGVRGAGFFRNDWSTQPAPRDGNVMVADEAWRDGPEPGAAGAGERRR